MILLSSLGLIVIIGLYATFFNKTEAKVKIETITVENGNISNSITATGTLEATNTVIVGTQVSGVIEKLYVDFNSIVKKGDLIAELDQSTLLSGLENAEADVENAEASLDYQSSNFNRVKTLFNKEMISESDYDQALFDYRKSKSNLKSANANLKKAQQNLSYAKIYAPIDGIVLNRAVEEGQTVAASMNTPELFTITNDLSSMQVEADIDEADIGQVKEGARVEFTVDAFPEEVFSGTVSEVRLQPQEVSNVITYTVIIQAQNPNYMLKPGMTAGITVFLNEHDNILVVEDKALRFTPDRQLLMVYYSNLPEEERPERMKNMGTLTNMNNMGSMKKQRQELGENEKIVWVKQGAIIRPQKITIGLSDGLSSQVISGLEDGDQVITRLYNENGSTSKKTTRSPFMPERPKRK